MVSLYGLEGLAFKVPYPGSNAHPAMGTTKDYCRYIKALLTPSLGAITTGGD